MTTIPALLEDAAERFGGTAALVDGELRLSFAELRDRVREMAAALAGWGLAPGDRVGVWGPNIWQWAVAALGVHVAGGVVVPINTRFKGDETEYVLDRSGARLLSARPTSWAPTTWGCCGPPRAACQHRWRR